MTYKSRFAVVMVVTALLSLVCGSAYAAGSQVEDAVNAFKSGKHVYVASNTESQVSAADAQALEDQINRSGAPVYIAVLPNSAKSEVNNNADNLPPEIGKKLGKPAVVGVVAGTSFRAGSGGNVTNFSSGEAGKLANDALNENNPGKNNGNVVPMLKSFADKSAREYSSRPSNSGGQSSGAGSTSAATTSSSQGSGFPWGTVLLVLLIIFILVVLITVFAVIAHKKNQKEDEAELSEIRLRSISNDLVDLEDQATLNPSISSIVDNGWSSYRLAEEAHKGGHYGMASSKMAEAEQYVRKARAILAPAPAEEPTPRTQTVRGGKPNVVQDDDNLVDYHDSEVDEEVRQSYSRAPQQPTKIVNVVNTYQQGQSYGNGYRYHQGFYPGYGYGYYPNMGYGYYGYNGDFVSGMLMADAMNDRHDHYRDREVDRLQDRVDDLERGHNRGEPSYADAPNGGDWSVGSSSEPDYSDAPNGGDWDSPAETSYSAPEPSYSAPEPSPVYDSPVSDNGSGWDAGGGGDSGGGNDW